MIYLTNELGRTGLYPRLTGEREGQHLSSTATIKNSDTRRAGVTAIMPCVGGLIVWYGFPDSGRRTDSDGSYADGVSNEPDSLAANESTSNKRD